jgi:hypothetical protein
MAQQRKNGKYQPQNSKYNRKTASTSRPPLRARIFRAGHTQAVARLREPGTIVQAMIDKAAEGSHLHAKLLFDFAGISATSLPPETEAERPRLPGCSGRSWDQMVEEAAEDERPVE